MTHNALRLLAIAFALGALIAAAGCTNLQPRAEALGAEAFDTLEGASALGVKASRRYLCRTARVGPLRDLLLTAPAKVEAWRETCDDERAPALPLGPADEP